eukprot:3803685-Rhodomonas_salina.4
MVVVVRHRVLPALGWPVAPFARMGRCRASRTVGDSEKSNGYDPRRESKMLRRFSERQSRRGRRVRK